MCSLFNRNNKSKQAKPDLDDVDISPKNHAVIEMIKEETEKEPISYLKRIAIEEYNAIRKPYLDLYRDLSSSLNGICSFNTRYCHRNAIVINEGGTREVHVSLENGMIEVLLWLRDFDPHDGFSKKRKRARVIAKTTELAVRFLASYMGDWQVKSHAERLDLEYEIYELD